MGEIVGREAVRLGKVHMSVWTQGYIKVRQKHIVTHIDNGGIDGKVTNNKKLIQWCL